MTSWGQPSNIKCHILINTYITLFCISIFIIITNGGNICWHYVNINKGLTKYFILPLHRCFTKTYLGAVSHHFRCHEFQSQSIYYLLITQSSITGEPYLPIQLYDAITSYFKSLYPTVFQSTCTFPQLSWPVYHPVLMQSLIN